MSVPPTVMSNPYLFAATIGLSSLLGSRSKRRAERRKIVADQTQYGKNAAAQTFSIQQIQIRAQELVAINRQNSAALAIAAKDRQAQIAANITVSAAQAGVSGDSVSLSLTSSQRDLARAERDIKVKQRYSDRQDQQDATDRVLTLEAKQGKFINNSSTSKTGDRIQAGLSFLEAYISKI